MCGRVGLTPVSTLEELPSSEISIQSYSKLGTQMSRQISSKYKNPICGKLDNDHQQKKWFAPCAAGRTARTGRMEVETLDHDESPRVTSFRAITYLHSYFSMLTHNEVPSRHGAESANLVNSALPMMFHPDVEQTLLT